MPKGAGGNRPSVLSQRHPPPRLWRALEDSHPWLHQLVAIINHSRMPKGEQSFESEFSHLDRNVNYSPLYQAWQEAFDRVVDLPGGRELTMLTNNNPGAQGLVFIQGYLAEKKNKLSPEAIFFLETTIELRKERMQKE